MTLELGLYVDEESIPTAIKNYGYVTLGNHLKLSNLKWNISERDNSKIALFTDRYFSSKFIASISRHKTKVAIVLEPLEYLKIRTKWDCVKFKGTPYENFVQNKDAFDLVLTYENSLLDLGGKYVPYIVGGSFLKPTDKILIEEKSSLISMVLSSKKILEGHRLRHRIFDQYSDKNFIEFYGNPFMPFDYQGAPFSRYKFSIVIENVKKNNFFTEKLLDCLLFKTIPIYYGDPKITKLFNSQGIIEFTTIDELRNILDDLIKGKIKVPDSVLIENQKRALRYISKEHNIESALRFHLFGETLTEVFSDDVSKDILEGKRTLDPSIIVT
jgi:hypothetical protein